MLISVVIPLFNEAQNLPVLTARLLNAMHLIACDYEIIYINDGSSDTTSSVLEQIAAEHRGIYYISFARNFGNQIAIFAGLEHASGDWVFTLDGDLQHPPEIMPQMLHLAINQGWKMVLGRRNKRAGEGFLKRKISEQFYKVYKYATGFEMPVDAADFRVMHKSIVDNLLQMTEKQKFIRGQLSWLGVPSGSVYYQGQERMYGKSGYSVSKLFKFAFDGITSFSNLPLKLATWLGFAVALLSFLLIIQAIYARFVSSNYQPGWSSLMIGILFLGGVQLLSLGIIGEYIGRINENVRKRPLYTVDKANIKKPI